MRRQSKLGVGYTELAERFGVTPATAFRAVIGRTWRHVRDGLPAHDARPEYQGAA
jgi:hypothetical protein